MREVTLKKIPRYKPVCDNCSVFIAKGGEDKLRRTKTYGWRVSNAEGTRTLEACAKCHKLLDHFIINKLIKAASK